VGGKFSEDQRAIYQGVLNAQRAVLDIMVPGTAWIECHKVRYRPFSVFPLIFFYLYHY